jgi:hypothetical protein
MQSVYSSPKEASSAAESLVVRRSPWGDRLIKIRESVLDLITRAGPAEVLNVGDNSDHISREAGKELPGELKRFIDMAKINAIDESGFTVNYESLRSSQPYNEYRNSCSPRLRYFDPQLLTTREEQLAFWINLYNALVMDGVISKRVTQSVGSNPLKLLAFFRQTSYNVAGHRMSCDDIEHGVLRGNRGHPRLPGRQFTSTDLRFAWIVDPVDVRIHFALNCAGRSCPPIQVYTAEDIDGQLNLGARNFVNADLSIDPDDHKVHLSAIFNWFREDFGGRDGIIDFLLQYLPEDDRHSWLLAHRDSIELQFKDYDWGLNSSNLQTEN